MDRTPALTAAWLVMDARGPGVLAAGVYAWASQPVTPVSAARAPGRWHGQEAP